MLNEKYYKKPQKYMPSNVIIMALVFIGNKIYNYKCKYAKKTKEPTHNINQKRLKLFHTEKAC